MTTWTWSGAIRTGEDDRFPHQWDTAPYILIDPSHNYVYIAQSRKEKNEAIAIAKQRESAFIIGIWPGQWRSDGFLISDFDAATLGLMTAAERKRHELLNA